MELTKTCTKCKECKPITEFTRNTTFKDGRTYNCSECIRIYHVKRNSTPEGKLKLQERNLKRKEYHSKYQKENREKANLFAKLRRVNNLEQTRLYEKQKSKSNSIFLSDKYIKNLLRQNGKFMKGITIPKEIIELKRIQIKTYRLCQQLQN
jgi:hypothetical protein